MKYLFIPIFIFFSFFLLNAEDANAATYYVCSSGCDYSTIQAAANIVNPGDTVIVKDGTYTSNSNSVVHISRSGNSNNWITFKSENERGAVIDGQGELYGYDPDNTSERCIAISNNVSYVRIEDFEFKGAWHEGIKTMLYVNNIVFYRNYFHDMGRDCTDTSSAHGTGIFLSAGASDITIDSNEFYNLGRLHPSDGCSYSRTNYQNHDHGIYMNGGTNIRVINNVFDTIKSGWHVNIHPGPETKSNVEVINNTFNNRNTFRDGYVLVSSVDGATIQNNIFYEPTGSALYVYGTTVSNVIVKNNLIYNVQSPNSDIWISGSSSGFTLQSPIEGDPLFIDEPSRDYTLQSGSPAIDAGEDVNAPSVDYGGTSRVSPYDIGAYEYGGTQPPPTYQCSDNIDNDGDNFIDMQDPGCSSTTDNDEFNVSQPSTCTSFTYSPWSSCQPNNTQTRTVTSSSPSGCTGGNPDTTRVCTYTPPPPGATFSEYYEAETITLTPPMTIGADTNASGGQYISPSTGINSTNPQQEASLTFSVPQTDTYYLWARMYGPDFSSDAIYVGIDSTWDRIFPSIINAYKWVQVETAHNTGNYQFNLTEGNHTFQVGHGEINARVDTLFITNDQSEIPTVPPQTTLLGDLDGNGTVNALDWSIMNSKWNIADTTADLNGDGVVNTLDWSVMNGNWGI